jgi:2-keto-4-pentenoate hydratase/2-oxohepta-3-ene-1,7-dioic acid hydratase in catechol pathway
VKLVTYEFKKAERLGALRDDQVIDLNAAYPAIPADMLGFLDAGEKALKAAKKVVASKERLPILPLKDVKLLAPLPNPRALRDFFAFEDHAKAGAKRRNEALDPAWYQQPVYYKGNHREIYGPGQTVPWPSFTRKLDFEFEIACVVGKKGRDLSPREAADHIAGYMIFNDWSARDIQKNEMVCRMGPAKGKDFANSFGPYLVTSDELPDPDGLKMTLRVNGEVWSSSDTGGRYWKFPLMLSHVSQEETVYPGDVLGSGTYFKGCGLDQDRWIKPGDVVEMEVEKLGVLKSVAGAPKEQKHLVYGAHR